jgi:hypothetical protein
VARRRRARRAHTSQPSSPARNTPKTASDHGDPPPSAFDVRRAATWPRPPADVDEGDVETEGSDAVVAAAGAPPPDAVVDGTAAVAAIAVPAVVPGVELVTRPAGAVSG